MRVMVYSTVYSFYICSECPLWSDDVLICGGVVLKREWAASYMTYLFVYLFV